MIKIAPSILSANFTRLGSDIDTIKNADQLHFDVMDGLFVPNLSFGLPVLKDVRGYTDMVINAHLMIDRPVRYVEAFCRAGADIVSVHTEADTEENISRAVDLIRSLGKKASVAIKPDTPASAVLPFIDRVSEVLCMTVEPGFGGQALRTDVMPKIAQVRRMAAERGLTIDVAVDGGVNESTAGMCVAAGANVLVNGSGVFRAHDRERYIEELRRSLSRYEWNG